MQLGRRVFQKRQPPSRPIRSSPIGSWLAGVGVVVQAPDLPLGYGLGGLKRSSASLKHRTWQLESLSCR